MLSSHQHISLSVSLALVATLAIPVTAQLTIGSFETGFDGWTLSGFQDQPGSISLSEIGATEGEQSLAVTQDNDGFSWNIRLDIPNTGPVRDAFSNALQDPSAYRLEYDVTFDRGQIPQGVDGDGNPTPSYVQSSIFFNSLRDEAAGVGGFRQKPNVPSTSGQVSETIHTTISFADPDLTGFLNPNSDWMQMGFSLNGDWGDTPATVFYDNIQINPVVSSTTLSIILDRNSGNVKLFNDSTAGDITLSAYSIQSAAETLNNSGWTSIATTGSDPGGDAWVETAATPGLISEQEDPANDGFNFVSNATFIDLGDIWYKNPIEDLVFSYETAAGQLTTGNVLIVGGFNNGPFKVGDLDFDNDLDLDDWTTFISHHKEDLSALTGAATYVYGDLDGNGANDFGDFAIFAQSYDAENGAGAFAALVPEPTCWAMLGLALVCGGFLLRRRRRTACPTLLAVFLAAIVIGWGTESTQAQGPLISSWEMGLEGWVVPDNSSGDVTVTLDTSDVAVTEGEQSLAMMQSDGDFSWNAFMHWEPGDDGFDRIANALRLGADLFELQMSVGYDREAFDNTPTFLQTFIAINSSRTWSQLDNLAEFFPPGDGSWDDVELRQIDVPFTQFDLASGEDTDFYDFFIGVNGDWQGPATFYFDNLRLQQVEFPPQITLEVDASTGSAALTNPGDEPLPFDYYEITSANGSLSMPNWNSLDLQNRDAVDGPDNGSLAGDSVGEGWDMAGGSSVFDLTEANLLRQSVLGAGQSIDIGSPFSPGSTQDLVFRFRNADKPDSIVTGLVEYMSELFIDFDNDGLVDTADIDLLINELGTGGQSATFDVDNSGSVDADDVQAWLSAAAAHNGFADAYLPGDADLNGTVDVADLNALGVNWQTNNLAWSKGNFVVPGTLIDASDLNAIGINWQFSIPIAAESVPEPASPLMLLMPIVGLALVKRNLFHVWD